MKKYNLKYSAYRSIRAAILLSLIFLIHPVHGESISETDSQWDAEESVSTENPGAEEDSADLNGFISDDPLEDADAKKPIHVIIDKEETGDSSEPNTDTDPVTDTGEISGDTYIAGDSGGSSATETILHKPQLLLEENNLLGQSFDAGSTKELSITFQNKSRSQKVFGLKISLSTETEGITFSRNSFYVPRLTPGESATITPTMTIAKDAQPGQVTLSFSLEYEDSKATGATGAETLTFFVVQPVKGELEVSQIPSVFYTMDTQEIPVKALNLGKDKLYNARISLEADGLTATENLFLGNIDAGTAGEGTLRVYVKGKDTDGNDADTSSKAGSTAGKLTLTYEDASGNSYETSMDFQSEIRESQIQSLEIEEQTETNGWWYSTLAVTALFLIVVILFLLARLRRKTILLEEVRKAGSH